ncbi:hypothetical protein [Aureimonas mangrovi]|nr:hypothetical protein [Aureimonas mangrovi]
MEFPSAQAAVARAERDGRAQTVDTGEVLEEPVVLARHGELPAGMLRNA